MLLFLGFRQNVSRETFCFLFFQLLIAKYILIYLKYDDAMGKRSESRCKLAQQLSYMTYDFNMDHDTDIKPIAKSEAHFNKWIVNYPFYSNIHKEGVVLYGAA